MSLDIDFDLHDAIEDLLGDGVIEAGTPAYPIKNAHGLRPLGSAPKMPSRHRPGYVPPCPGWARCQMWSLDGLSSDG